MLNNKNVTRLNGKVKGAANGIWDNRVLGYFTVSPNTVSNKKLPGQDIGLGSLVLKQMHGIMWTQLFPANFMLLYIFPFIVFISVLIYVSSLKNNSNFNYAWYMRLFIVFSVTSCHGVVKRDIISKSINSGYRKKYRNPYIWTSGIKKLGFFQSKVRMCCS